MTLIAFSLLLTQFQHYVDNNFQRQTDRYVNMISKQKTETQHLVSIQATHVESIFPQQMLSKIRQQY